MINFSVTFNPGVPIYEQIVYAAKRAFVSGQLKPGDRFPSVRELSKEFHINPNTAQKVVAHLVRERLLDIKPGIGSIVADYASATEEQRAKILDSDIEKLVVEAKRLSIQKKEMIDAINLCWGKDKDGKK